MCSQLFAGFKHNGGRCALVKVPACLRQRLGCKLTNLFGTIESVEIRATPVASAKKHTWLPVLTVLFMVSYAIMTLLIVEQGQTIESQRALIRELFRDSSELSATKMRDQRAQASHMAQNPSSQTPAAQAPSTQAPTKQAPSTQVEPQHRVQNQVKPRYQVPSKPASDLA